MPERHAEQPNGGAHAWARAWAYVPAALISVGAIVIGAALWFAEGMERPILRQPLALWSVLVVGGALIGLGLMRYVQAPHSAAEAALREEENDFIVSLRIWLIAAAADGVLHDAEIEVIIANARKFFGREIDETFVRRTYELMKKRTKAPHIDAELLGSALPLTAEGVKHTLFGAIFVALFDGELDDAERRVIRDLADRFDLDDGTVDGLIAEVRAAIAAD